MNTPQSAFRAGLLDPSVPTPLGLTNPNGTPAQKRFDVYRNNVTVGLMDALEAAFPIIRKLVGDQFFRAMADVFVRAHPPQSPLMMFYGDAMPAFLNGFPPAQTVPYLPDIARLELAMRKSYHAADAQIFDPAAISALDESQIFATRFRFAPATVLIRSSFPIHAIYRANTQPDAPSPKMRPESVLITRPQFDPVQHLVDAPVADCITALIEGRSLGEALQSSDAPPETVLGLLLSSGALASIT